MDNPEFREPKGRNTMTEQNQTPAADDTEGHHFRDDAQRDDSYHRTGDDVEGHQRHRSDDDSDDVEGHQRHRGDDDDTDGDVDGHLHRI
jgi:hypothetical protein